LALSTSIHGRARPHRGPEDARQTERRAFRQLPAATFVPQIPGVSFETVDLPGKAIALRSRAAATTTI
jgi:hypothetical protein